MAEPPAAKKQKVSKPIVFSTPGYHPDVRLVVFDQEFHVHSILLKLHSAYFRKFLDSPDKAPKVTNAVSAGGTDGFGPTTADNSRIFLKGPQGSFKYHWVTKIDGDHKSSWYLTAAKSDTSPSPSPDFSGDVLRETRMFETMLCAIYVKPYHILSYDDLFTLTELADFYCALPIVSRTLDMAFHSSQDFVNRIPDNRCQVFELAAKLRNKLLFKEALVWIMGPWAAPSYQRLKDPKLRKIAHRAYTEITSKIAEIDYHLLTTISDVVYGTSTSIQQNEVKQAMDKAAQEAVNRPDFCMPRYFRELDHALKGIDGYSEWVTLPEFIKGLRKCNLVLNRGSFESGKIGPVVRDTEYNDEGEEDTDWEADDPSDPGMEDYFLCAEIEDDDLPWDINETDF